MEEADVLCNRIGIVTDGILRCVGPQIRLKTIYGGGYHLFINCHKSKYIKLLEKERSKKRRNAHRQRAQEQNGEKSTFEIHQKVKDFVYKMCPNAINIKDLVFQVS